MIKWRPDGGCDLTFEDWTQPMADLSFKLAQLPKHHDLHDRQHDLGIERLAKLSFGALVIPLLILYADDLDHRPDDLEVIEMGKSIVRTCLELQLVQQGLDISR